MLHDNYIIVVVLFLLANCVYKGWLLVAQQLDFCMIFLFVLITYSVYNEAFHSMSK